MTYFYIEFPQSKRIGKVGLPGERYARIKHDWHTRFNTEMPYYPRVFPDLALYVTNEIYPLRPVVNDTVDGRGKITMPLVGTEWEDVFRYFMTDYIFSWFRTDGKGWMDTGDNVNYSALPCSGQLLKINSQIGAYSLPSWIDYQNPQAAYKLSYENDPHLMIKQVLIGVSKTDHDKWYAIVDKIGFAPGDLVWPLVCDQRPAIETEFLEFFPELPYESSLGTVEKWLFHGSNTDGLINGEWVPLEWMNISGNGNQDDWGYIPDWPMYTCPAPVIGWSRTE